MKRGARRRLTRIGTKHVEQRWTGVNRVKGREEDYSCLQHGRFRNSKKRGAENEKEEEDWSRRRRWNIKIWRMKRSDGN